MRATVTPNGILVLGTDRFRAALGRGGVRADKREGDGATPVALLPLRLVLYRPDRGGAPACAVPVKVISPRDGWCDDPADPAYNRPVRLPIDARCIPAGGRPTVNENPPDRHGPASPGHPSRQVLAAMARTSRAMTEEEDLAPHFLVSAEALWRDDSVYDIIGVLGWNDAPVRPGLGSAIFLHVARPDFAPTEGCVALELDDLRRVLAMGLTEILFTA